MKNFKKMLLTLTNGLKSSTEKNLAKTFFLANLANLAKT
jgi:hypothetical protein